MEGILFALPETIRYPSDLVHLWLHESSRVYSDKLMEEKDVELFNKILLDTGKRYFEVRSVISSGSTFSGLLRMMSMQSRLLCLLIHICRFPYLYLQGVDESMFIHQPLVYCHFAQGVGEPRYHQVPYFHQSCCAC